ncbi:MAG: hypothetical protein QXD03_05405 [Candidatus Anstonellales archaeon]
MEKRFRRILKLFNKIFNEDKEVILIISDDEIDVGGMATIINGIYHVIIFKESLIFKTFKSNKTKLIVAENTIVSHEVSHVYLSDIELFYSIQDPTVAVLFNALEDYRIDYITDMLVIKGHKARMTYITGELYKLIERAAANLSQGDILKIYETDPKLNLMSIPMYLNGHTIFNILPTIDIRNILNKYKEEVHSDPFNKEIVYKYIDVLLPVVSKIDIVDYMSMFGR